MKRTIRHLAILASAGLMTIVMAGCDAAYRSKINVTLCKRAEIDATVPRSEESTEGMTIRRLLIEKGYAIRDGVEGDPFVRQELGGERFKTLWCADKKYNPTVIYTQNEKHSTFRLFQLSGPMRPRTITQLTDEIRSSLVSACSADGVEIRQY
jgi:hypothetical protein